MKPSESCYCTDGFCERIKFRSKTAKRRLISKQLKHLQKQDKIVKCKDALVADFDKFCRIADAKAESARVVEAQTERDLEKLKVEQMKAAAQRAEHARSNNGRLSQPKALAISAEAAKEMFDGPDAEFWGRALESRLIHMFEM